MRRWQAWLVTGILCFVGLPAVQAQTLFERLGQAFNQAAPPSPADESAPDTQVPEALPTPQQPAPPSTGRATLGVTVDPVTDDLVRQLRLPVRSGALITAVVQSSPADQAGLPVGAVIVALDGRRIDSPADLVAAIRTAPTGREIELSYYEGDRLYRKRVNLLGTATTQVAPTAPPPVRRESQPPRNGPSLEQQLGGRGGRPILGRVGQLLDELVAPGAGGGPLAQPVPESSEVQLLREQVAALQQELQALRLRLVAVERQLERPADR